MRAAVPTLRVCATAGHVDHGKSSLITSITGIDPDRWAEEKRRGLTIDLGYAWTSLPSGREIGFVDVPGHERFIGNMLAGVGPIRLVLFVVAADEGWRPQSEEHLQILDVLGVSGGVVALTKRDLVDVETLEIATEEIRERLEGTALAGSPIVPVSAVTGEGVRALVEALDDMFGRAPEPTAGRSRLFVDRAFTITGAGTVVTGTLSGAPITVDEEIEVLPAGVRSRVRGLQTHKREGTSGVPVSRVAVNLVGVDRGAVQRGDVLVHPGEWEPTQVFEASLRTVRGLDRPITARGAFKVHIGASEIDAKIRLYATTRLEPGREAFVRVRLARPAALEPFDRFVLRDAGRRRTVGGGAVLDVDPPRRAGREPEARLAARAAATRDELPGLLVGERGVASERASFRATGSTESGGVRIGEWFVARELHDALGAKVEERLADEHHRRPLEEGVERGEMRRVATDVLRGHGAPADRELVEAVLADRESAGSITRVDGKLRLASHEVRLDHGSQEVTRLLEALSGDQESTPPPVKELLARGFDPDVIDAAARAGAVVRLSRDLVVAPSLVERAMQVVTERGAAGITVSELRERLGTSRKYAVPLAEYLDRAGLTRREGDLRYPAGT